MFHYDCHPAHNIHWIWIVRAVLGGNHGPMCLNITDDYGRLVPVHVPGRDGYHPTPESHALSHFLFNYPI